MGGLLEMLQLSEITTCFFTPVLDFLAASWSRSESAGLDRLGVGACFECQSGNLATADTFSMAFPPAACFLRGGGVGHVRARAR